MSTTREIINHEIYDESNVSLSEMNWDNQRMRISFGNLWVSVSYNGYDTYTVYYYNRKYDNSAVPSCWRAPGKYKNQKSAETQIKNYFRKY